MGAEAPDLSNLVRGWLVEGARSAPQYRRLAEFVRELIVSGELPLGTRLPSERDLAEAASMSRTTVITAYNLLRADSLLMTERRVGTWVSSAPR